MPHSIWKERPEAAVYVCPLLAGQEGEVDVAVAPAPDMVEVVKVAVELLSPVVRDDVAVLEEELTLRVVLGVLDAAGWVLGLELRSMFSGAPK